MNLSIFLNGFRNNTAIKTKGFEFMCSETVSLASQVQLKDCWLAGGAAVEHGAGWDQPQGCECRVKMRVPRQSCEKSACWPATLISPSATSWLVGVADT